MFNKYRKRHIHNTVNLLTGEADVAPGSIKVRHVATPVRSVLERVEHFKYYYVERCDCFSLLPLKVPQGATGVPPEIVSYYHPNLTLNLVDDHTHWVEGTIPQPMDKCEWSL